MGAATPSAAGAAAPTSDAIVFFGATGDLAFKQIFPALQALVRDEGVNKPIIGVAKAGWSLDQLRDRAKESLKHAKIDVDSEVAQRMLGLLRYVDGDYNAEATFTQLHHELGGAKRPLHYLAVPPAMFSVVAAQLAKSGCAENARLVVEKPFGHDRASARELGRLLNQFFPEENIFRIDHYLGKEPVQNVIYTRFVNPMFEPIWNRDHVASIQITMAEAFGVQDRGSFYDATGAIRDVLQNHMLQLLANLTMDPPAGDDHESARDQKAALLKAVKPLDARHVVRGQYAGYRDVHGVAPDSGVETFVAVKLEIDSWRWAGVPIYIRAGKELPVTAAEINVEFKRPPRETYGEVIPTSSSRLRMRISPDVSIGLGMRVKTPGEHMVGHDVELILTERTIDDRPPYERLLGDAMHGIADLFTRRDLVDAQWRIVEDVLGDATPLYPYAAQSWGPTEAVRLIDGDGPWIDPKVAEPAA